MRHFNQHRPKITRTCLKWTAVCNDPNLLFKFSFKISTITLVITTVFYSESIKRLNKRKYWKSVYPRNLADVGPISRILLASASPSISGGGCVSFSFLTSLHVTRVGMQALPGGMMMRTPEWRHPRIAPPRASTMKLTKKLSTPYSRWTSSGLNYGDTVVMELFSETSQIFTFEWGCLFLTQCFLVVSVIICCGKLDSFAHISVADSMGSTLIILM